MIMQQSKAQYRLRELLERFPQDEYMDKKRELAKRLNIGKPQLDRLIRGDSDPSGTQLRIMADFFNSTVDALYQKSST